MKKDDLLELIDTCLDEKEKLLNDLEEECIILMNFKSHLENKRNSVYLRTNFKERGLTNQGLQKSYVDDKCEDFNKIVEKQKIKIKTMENRIKFLSEKIRTVIELNKLILEVK